MKWLSRKRSKNRSFGAKKTDNTNFLASASQLTILIICLIGTGVFLSGNISLLKTKIFGSDAVQKPSTEIKNIATDISVKILSEDFLGSGFIVFQELDRYTVITNQHVLRAGIAPYSIQTADGKIYSAEVLPDSDILENQYDLAVLEFMANNATYPTAKIGRSLDLEVGEPIYAAGFPYTRLKEKKRKPAIFEQSKISSTDSFVLKPGRIAIILNQALEEGYQIGYTNDVKKGMSGGPLLNSQGEVVGVNGKHAYPLWESPEIYQDGSQPCPALQELITRSSLAIPIEKTTELNPKLKSLRTPSDVRESKDSNWSSANSKLVDKMRAEAEATNKSCENYVDRSINR